MRRALRVITVQCVTRSMVAHSQLVSRIALVNVEGEKRTHTHTHSHSHSLLPISFDVVLLVVVARHVRSNVLLCGLLANWRTGTAPRIVVRS